MSTSFCCVRVLLFQRDAIFNSPLKRFQMGVKVLFLNRNLRHSMQFGPFFPMLNGPFFPTLTPFQTAISNDSHAHYQKDSEQWDAEGKKDAHLVAIPLTGRLPSGLWSFLQSRTQRLKPKRFCSFSMPSLCFPSSHVVMFSTLARLIISLLSLRSIS